jgi:hypothetical protein
MEPECLLPRSIQRNPSPQPELVLTTPHSNSVFTLTKFQCYDAADFITVTCLEYRTKQVWNQWLVLTSLNQHSMHQLSYIKSRCLTTKYSGECQSSSVSSSGSLVGVSAKQRDLAYERWRIKRWLNEGKINMNRMRSVYNTKMKPMICMQCDFENSSALEQTCRFACF